MTPARPGGQAEGRGRVSLLLPGLGNYSDYADTGGLSELETRRSGSCADTERERETPQGGRTRQTQSGEAERKGHNWRKKGTEAEMEIDKWGERERNKKEAATERRGARRGEARAQPEDARARRPSSRRCPRAPTRPRPAGFGSATHLLRVLCWPRKLLPRNGNRGRVWEPLRAQRCPLATPCRAHIPSPSARRGSAAASQPRSPGSWTGRDEAHSRGRGAAPVAEASGSRAPACRPGQDLPRSGEGGAPAGSCGAVCGPRGWQARGPRDAREGGRQG